MWKFNHGFIQFLLEHFVSKSESFILHPELGHQLGNYGID